MGLRRSGRTVAALLAATPAAPGAAQARVIAAETVLPPGQSGFVPPAGQPENRHLTDQIPLFESFAFEPAGFDEPGATETPRAGVTITRDAHGVPDVRAGSDRDVEVEGVAPKPQLKAYDRGTWSQAAELGL